MFARQLVFRTSLIDASRARHIGGVWPIPGRVSLACMVSQKWRLVACVFTSKKQSTNIFNHH